VAEEPLVSSFGPHFGEEPPLVGVGGSGTIFFAGCNLACAFCQNFDISHGRLGQPVAPGDIAELALALEARGCHNINLVTPTHVTPQVAEAIETARRKGLRAPIVYNCGGYESLDMLHAIEGLVEIYMPDAKYWDPETARRLSQAPDYPEVMRRAIREMHRQVGDLEVVGGVARRGLLVRHLVMPGQTDQARGILDFLARDISPRTYVNVMPQYRPTYRAHEHPEVDRRPTGQEVAAARDHAIMLGLQLAE
jgi:putative pyruvate formate lyase activating enzyme